MAKVLQHRRGTSSEHANFTGAAGEITFDTTNKRLVAHDGSTEGGIPMAKVSEVASLQEELNSLDVGVTSVNGSTGAVVIPEGVKTVNGNAPDVDGNISPSQTGCLPLTGGTVTGAIVVAESSTIAMSKASQNKYLRLCGGNVANDGAKIDLYGSSGTLPGSFQITAQTRTGSNVYSLIGRPDGTFTWNGKKILTESTLSAYITETWSDGTSWYRKYSDGFIEQGGVANGAKSGAWTSVVITLPTAFKDTNYSIASSFVSMNTTYCSNGCITAKSATSFTQYFFYNNGIVPTWYACGY